MQKKGGRKKSRSKVGRYCLEFFFCVLFPGFITAIAPVSHIRFERTGDGITARARICAFFFVPYRTKKIDPVIGVGDRYVAGKDLPRRGGERQRQSEAEAFLVIRGEDETLEVPVSPLNADRVTKRAEEFLSNRAPELSMTVVANWKFSVIVGGLISLLTVLYVGTLALAVARWVRRQLGFANAARSAAPPGAPK